MPAENTIIFKLPSSFLSDLNGYFIHNVLLIPVQRRLGEGVGKVVGERGWERPKFGGRFQQILIIQ